jgi:hypothetical protein
MLTVSPRAVPTHDKSAGLIGLLQHELEGPFEDNS